MSGAASGAPHEETTGSSGVPASEVLAGIPRDAEAGAEEVLLDPRVAAALRTALDFLALADGVSRQPLAVSRGPSLLEVRCTGIDPAGVLPASELLEPVSGCLGPLGAGTWRIRVPARSAETWYLAVVQGVTALAIPWHCVLQIRLAKDDAIAGLAAREGCSVLPAAAGGTGERPVVLIGLGLKRALLPVDRLVWRLPAEPLEPTPAEPPAPFERAVRAADGETYWVAEPRILLRDVTPPSIPSLARGLARAEGEASSAPLRTSPAEPETVPPALPELSADDVQPLDESRSPAPMGEEPISEPSIAPHVEPSVVEAPLEARPAEYASAVRRALVAEDSIMARIFLWRMLEQQGFQVRTVASIAELRNALEQGPWSLICVDVDLPDGHGAAHVRTLAASTEATLVALTRDAHDEAAAAAAGVTRALRKPFDTQALARLLAELPENGAR